MKNEKAIRKLLEEIKTAAGKSQRDVYFFLKADEAIALLKPCSLSGEFEYMTELKKLAKCSMSGVKKVAQKTVVYIEQLEPLLLSQANFMSHVGFVCPDLLEDAESRRATIEEALGINENKT